MTTTPVFGIPELVQGQNTPHTTFNVAIALATAMQGGAIDLTNTPPGSPSEGDVYVVGTAGTGAWSGRNNCIAIYYGAQWRFVPGNDDAGSPIAMGASQEGFRIYVKDENQMYVWSGSAWTAQGVGPFLPLTGGTLTGAVSINAGAGQPLKLIQTTAGLATTDSALLVESQDAGAVGPTGVYYHNSASPAANDTSRPIRFAFNNTTPTKIEASVLDILISSVTPGSESFQVNFNSRQSGTNTTRLSYAAGLYMTSATGGDQGAGTINAIGVYDDGVLLCAPLHALDVDKHQQSFWDGLVPDRKIEYRREIETIPAVLSAPDPLTGEQTVIEPARVVVTQEARTETVETTHRTAKRYFDMLAAGFDARDPENFFAYVDEHKAVPGLPTLEEHEARYPIVNGERTAKDKYTAHERMERMQLALDYLVLMNRSLYDRIKALEAGSVAVQTR